MTFYFAWVGGTPIPAFDLVTVGDIWGGSAEVVCQIWAGKLETTADFLPSINWRRKVTEATNMRSVDGLVVGRVYKATIGEVISDFIYEGDYSGTLSNSRDSNGLPYLFMGVEPAEGLAMLLQSDTGITDIVLNDTSKLVVGTTYNVSGGSTSPGTIGTYTGSNTISVNNNNNATARDVTLTFSTTVGQNRITNLGSTVGLVIGNVYQLFARGLSGTVLGTFEADNTFLLSELPTVSTKQAHLRIHHGIIYPDGGTFDEVAHARNDEEVLSIDIKQSEGNAALLTIKLKNPHMGYLYPGRNIWCWLSWREVEDGSPSGITPLFHGRLVTVPDEIKDEEVTLQFLAKPSEYENLQTVLAATLRVNPYWDPIWYSNGVDDKDTILEARPDLWHTDRTTLEVSISNITSGEDGTLFIGENDHIYADLDYKIGNPPLAAVYMTGTVTWTQEANDTVDLTDTIRQVFYDGGSRFGRPNISAYQGSGLLSSWPKPLQNIGAGWQVNADTIIIESTRMFGTTDILTKYTTSFSAGQDFNDAAVDDWGNPTGSAAKDAQGSYVETHALFKLSVYKIAFLADFSANREWTESVSFFLEADVQQVASDSRASVEAFSLSSDLISKRIDPGGVTPIRDLRDNTYFKSDRGQQSFRFLLAYARAKLIVRARAVEITLTTTWHKGISVSCRKNVHIIDSRLPGGSAVGKVIDYTISASANGGMRVVIKIGCTVGNGGTIPTTVGAGNYVNDNYVDHGYQTEVDGTIDFGDGSIVYETFDDFEVVDDGVNFYNMTPQTVVRRCQLVGGINQQKTAIAATIPLPAGIALGALNSISKQPLDPATVLTNCYPHVLLELVPVTGGAFLSEFYVDVSKLAIAKTIDLAAG